MWPKRVGTGIALLFHDRGTRKGRAVSSTPRPHFTPGKDTVPTVQEAGWAPGPVWTGGKSRPHRDSIPYRPARSQSLYRLSYPAHIRVHYSLVFHVNCQYHHYITHVQHTFRNCNCVLESNCCMARMQRIPQCWQVSVISRLLGISSLCRSLSRKLLVSVLESPSYRNIPSVNRRYTPV